MEAFIVSAVRTPIGKYGRSFANIPAQQLGSLVVKEAVKRAGIEFKDVDEVIMGNVIQAGLGQNPARQAALMAGMSTGIAAFTVNKVCGSGLKAVMLAAQAIKAEDSDIILAGGMESMSGAPYLLKGARFGLKYNNAVMYDAMLLDGLLDAYNDVHMIKTGEIVAERHKLTREEIDEFAYKSHMKAEEARRSKLFMREIVEVPTQSGSVYDDECIRADTTLDKLASLKPVLPDGKYVTAGNASQLSDGASALVIASRRKLKEMHLEPIAKIIAYNTVGVDPLLVMEAPIPGVRSLLSMVKMKIDDIDIVEHNEAYASASVVVRRELGIPEDRFNIHGGAVALGHPLGASGARILTTLLYNLIERRGRYGIATLCLGGGNAVSMLVENLRR
ncbi:MAG: thiolase family protein [Conexivisphaerales archaeon]